jgi:hypothetical protein
MTKEGGERMKEADEVELHKKDTSNQVKTNEMGGSCSTNGGE